MEIIVGHYGTDFDCLAAMIAAKKIHPRGICVLPGRVDRNVRGFLDEYEDEFELHRPRDVDVSTADRLIVVDTRRANRLGAAVEALLQEGDPEVTLYDHHPDSDSDIEADEAHVRSVGATTTILTGIIREQGIALTPVEATTLALGIYEDTGSLSFSSTTVEDVLAVAFLLEQGADLDVVSRHIRYSLSEEQRSVLNQFLLSIEHVSVAGVKVAFAEAVVAEYVADVAVLTQKLAVTESVDAIFTTTQAGPNVYVAARSRTDSLDVGEVLAGIGGGGHHRSASAVLRHRVVSQVRDQLRALVSECVRPPRVARDLMSYPVRMIQTSTTVQEAKKVLLRYGYSGILVADDGNVVGSVSRKELDKALHHGLGHAPVKSCMMQDVAFATLDTPAHELQELLINHRVGRVPITGPDGEVVGIVTRADLRSGTHHLSGREHRTYHGDWCGVDDVSSLLRSPRHDRLAELVTTLGRTADNRGVAAFLVGGGVRDLLLGAEGFDVDVLIEGNAIDFARAAAPELRARVTAHEKFVTACLVLPGDRKVDVASARTEFYQSPAALPEVEVEHSSVKDDLYRRDFTINAMAVQINQAEFGRLFDFFGGRSDLDRGVIRVLHSLSFVEDPTRVFRAVRFEQRLRFRIEEQTEQLLTYALESELFSALASERVRDELILILSEPDPIPAVHRMSHLGIWEHVHEKIVFDNQALDELRRTTEVLTWLAGLSPPVEPLPWLAYLCPLLREMTPTAIRDIARRLRIPREHSDELSFAAESLEFILPALDSEEPIRPSNVHQLLEPQQPLVLARLLVCARPGGPARERIESYLMDYRHFSLETGGRALLQLGYTPGPPYGRVLRRLLAERLDGETPREREGARLVELAEEIIGHTDPAAGRRRRTG